MGNGNIAVTMVITVGMRINVHYHWHGEKFIVSTVTK